MKLNMIIVAILVLRFLVKLRFPANTSITVVLLCGIVVLESIVACNLIL